ncbi:MAG: DUF2442 domain-containing protein [Candidatus Desantisbacteria bacterium]
MILHVTDARYLDGHKVEVSFNDGRKGIANLSNALRGPVFQPLKDESIFAQLKLDKELDTISWPNGADIAPEYLYFQAFKGDSELQEQFKTWGYIVQPDS